MKQSREECEKLESEIANFSAYKKQQEEDGKQRERDQCVLEEDAREREQAIVAEYKKQIGHWEKELQNATTEAKEWEAKYQKQVEEWEKEHKNVTAGVQEWKEKYERLLQDTSTD